MTRPALPTQGGVEGSKIGMEQSLLFFWEQDWRKHFAVALPKSGNSWR